MALTPLDLEQIAALVKAGSCGYLPPYLLGEQLQFRVTVLTGIQLGDTVVAANPNRVWLAVCGGASNPIIPQGGDLATAQGFLVGGNVDKPWPLTVKDDGVMPQLQWINPAPGPLVFTVYEQVWSPPSGLGVV